MTPDEQAAVRERWQQAGDQVAAHDDAQQSQLRDQVSSAERAVLDVVQASTEPPTPTRVLELLARGATASASQPERWPSSVWSPAASCA